MGGSSWRGLPRFGCVRNNLGAGAVAKLHFLRLHPDGARRLVAERAVKAVGLDTASIDSGQSTLFESHHILFEKNIPAFENVAALDRFAVVW